MSFQSPEFLFLFFPLLILFWYTRRRQRPAVSIPSAEQFRTLNSTWRVRWAFVPQALQFLSLGSLILGLSRPQVANQQIKRNVQGVDIMIALDISDSMLIEDMRPLNRLEAAKETISTFVKNRSTDRLGVLVFAGESFTLVPLTLDYELLLSRVSEITTARQARIKDGTALGVALANGAARLKDSTAKTRILIFLTDGENNSGTIDPETGLEVAKGYGIKIYSIGIGKDGPTRIPVYSKDAFGQTLKTYQAFESKVNDDLLSRMAAETGGKYYRASQETSLQAVFADIDSLEKTSIEINKYLKMDEKFMIWVWISVVLGFLAWAFSESVFRRLP